MVCPFHFRLLKRYGAMYWGKKRKKKALICSKKAIWPQRPNLQTFNDLNYRITRWLPNSIWPLSSRIISFLKLKFSASQDQYTPPELFHSIGWLATRSLQPVDLLSGRRVFICQRYYIACDFFFRVFPFLGYKTTCQNGKITELKRLTRD